MLTFPQQIRGTHRAKTRQPDRPGRHVHTPQILFNPRKTLPRSAHLLANHGRPPPARRSLPRIFPCCLLRNNRTGYDGGDLPVLHRLHLAPHKRCRVRAWFLPSSRLMSDRSTAPRSTTLDLLPMVRVPTSSTPSLTFSPTSTPTVIGRVDGVSESTSIRGRITDPENQ